MNKFILIILVYFSNSACAEYIADNVKNESTKYAIGWKDNIGYSLPKPGSYKLYNIRKSEDGNILNDKGNPTTLHKLMNNKITLLSFIYSNCTDTNGCPLATSIFYKIRDKFKNEKKLKDKVKMISLSLDPVYDTPKVMSLYGKNFNNSGLSWEFVTTRSLKELEPILKSYDQPVIRKYHADGSYNGVESHLLRVYLIDNKKLVRNIYSVDFLHADLLINDLKSLLLLNE